MVKNYLTAKGAKAMEEAIKRGILGRVKKESFAGNAKDLAERIGHNKKTYGSDVKKASYKANPLLRGFDQEDIDKKIIEDGLSSSPADRDKAINRLLNETYTSLDAKDIKDMDEDAFTYGFIRNTTGKKLARAGDLVLSLNKKKKLKDLVKPGSKIMIKYADLKREEANLRSRGKAAAADKVKIDADKLLNTINAIKKL